MDGSRPHVLVVGGGIGGLCLAQGLRRSGVGVAVYERDLCVATALRTASHMVFLHTVSPGRGEGANTALLAGQLAGVATGRLPLAVAKRRYEVEMVRYGFEAVAASKELPFGPRRAPARAG